MTPAVGRSRRRSDPVVPEMSGEEPARRLAALQARHRACRRCVDAGFLPSARPVFAGHAGQRMLLVGQAPGPVEAEVGRPFAGRAGRELVRWMQRAGFADDADVRRRIYFTSVTTCFPGRRPDASGDRRPSAAEVALCAPWLDELLAILQPRLLLLVGTLAVNRFLPGRRLDDVVGRVLLDDGRDAPLPPVAVPRVLLPLPHPSGQSRWLNEPAHKARLAEALGRLASLVPWAEAAALQAVGEPSGVDAMLS